MVGTTRKERDTMSEARHIDKAICAIKLAIAGGGGFAKDRQSPMGYKFRSIEDFDRILCGMTAEHNVDIYPRVTKTEINHGLTKNGAYQCHVFLTMDFDFVSAVDGSVRTITTIGEAMDTQDKASNKAMQAARKYADILVFRIPVAGDDTEIYVPEPAVAAKPEPAPSPVTTTQGDPMAAQIANGAVAPVAGPGPAKTKAAKVKKEAAPEPGPFNENGAPAPSEELLGRIGEVNTFPVLYAMAQECDKVTTEPQRTELFTAIQHRAIFLFAGTKSLAETREGFPLVQALGEPTDLKKAANAAFSRHRST